MKNSTLHILPALLVIAFLSGCAGNPFSRGPFYENGLGTAQSLRTADIDIQRERFGVLADMVGKPLMSQGGSYFESAWIVPGAILQYQSSASVHYRITYNSDNRQLLEYSDFSDLQEVQAVGNVKPDGSIRWRNDEYESSYWMIRSPDGFSRVEDSGARQVYTQNSAKFAAAVRNDAARYAEAQRYNAAEDAEDLAYKAEMQARAIGQILQSAQTEMAASHVASPRPVLAAAPRPAAAVASQPLAAAVPKPGAVMAASKPLPAAEKKTMVALSEGRGKQLPSTFVAQPPPDPASENLPQKKRWAETPEAIIVCTKPEGPNGNFKCMSPVTVGSGHLKDISGYRTPAEMVRNGGDGCPERRPLQSSTHLVWGCGFGATNNSNSIDRSDGVDVRGRRTYYCGDKETSCRRAAP